MAENKPSTVHGDCRMCGGKDRDLWMLFLADYADWTCSECISQVIHCQQRLYVNAGETTEPAE